MELTDGRLVTVRLPGLVNSPIANHVALK